MAHSQKVEDHRRKWDKDEYERIARKRIEEEQEALREKEEGSSKPFVRRELLKPRDYKVDLDSKLGKSVVITKTTPSAEAGGYFCNVCDCVVKDSINFLDHINGKKHQRNMGMSMKVKKATVDDVRERLEAKKLQVEEKRKDYDLEERLKELKEEETKLSEYRKQKRIELKKRKRGVDEEDESLNPEMATMLGFSGFGGGPSKK